MVLIRITHNNRNNSIERKRNNFMNQINKNFHYGTGRRKSSVARVYLRPGDGSFEVNGRTLDDFFCRETSRMIVKQPLKATDLLERFSVKVNVSGGGTSGQAGAILLGIARALVKFDKNGTEASEGALGLKKILSDKGYVTRDARRVERKKFGKKKARKSSQYSKR